MKNIILYFMFVAAFLGKTNAQVAGWKKFSVLNNRNAPLSPVNNMLANVLTIFTKASTEPVASKPNMEEIKKENNVKPKRAAKTNIIITKDPNIFVVDGITSTAKLNTIAAKFGFAGAASDTANIQLYKAEIKDGKRIFSVIPGKTLCEKIPIHFSLSLQGNEGGIIGIILQNNLLSGEYLFIDKASLVVDASQIKCYGFTIL